MTELILFSRCDFNLNCNFDQKIGFCLSRLKKLEGGKFQGFAPASSMTKDIDQYG